MKIKFKWKSSENRTLVRYKMCEKVMVANMIDYDTIAIRETYFNMFYFVK